jgi:glycosylphosphatidylinositol deacylase
MHNNGEYQYFALDFNESKTAFHASYVISQSIFMNDALKAIQKLYKENDYHMKDIIIVAHSMGGIVARTAILLSNHPACIVSNMILLSSPNTR